MVLSTSLQIRIYGVQFLRLIAMGHMAMGLWLVIKNVKTFKSLAVIFDIGFKMVSGFSCFHNGNSGPLGSRKIIFDTLGIQSVILFWRQFDIAIFSFGI